MVVSCSPKDFPLGTLGYVTLWTTLAISSIVLIEPAPCDILAVGLLPFLFVFGLRVPANLTLPFLLIATYVAGYGISGFFAANFAAAVPHLMVTAYLSFTFLVFTCILYHRPMQSLQVIMTGYLIGAVFAALVGIVTYFGWVPHSTDYLGFGTRAKGLFKDPNVYGPYLIPPAMYLIATMIDAKLGRAIFNMGLFLFLSLGLFLSFSRGAWGSLALAFFVFLALALFTTRSKFQMSRLVLVGVATVVLGVLLVAWALSMNKVGALFEVRASLLQNYDTGAQGRFAMQKAAFGLAMHDPFGIGPGQWERLFPEDPHNVYLKMIATGGWITGLSYYAMVLVTLWRGFRFCFTPWRGQMIYIALFASYLAVVAEGVIIDTDHWRHFYLLMALIWGPALALEPRGQTAARTNRPGLISRPETQPADTPEVRPPADLPALV